jgi:hypothetical protein
MPSKSLAMQFLCLRQRAKSALTNGLGLGLGLGLILCFSGCGVAPLVEPGKPVLIKDISIDSPIAWSQFGDARSRLWTIDGTLLNNFHVFADIKSGEHVFLNPKGRAERKGEGLLFNAQMSELEVRELIVDAIRGSDAVNVTASNLRPAKFGARPGFRFDLNFESGSGTEMGNRGGLKYRAMVLAETQGGTLSYALFYAPTEYYFGRDQAHVEQIFSRISAP